MSLDLLASLSRPNVIREDLPKHHLVIIKKNIQYNHRKEYPKKTVDPIQESDFAIGGSKAVKPKPVLPSSNPMDVRISASKGPKRVFI